MLENGISNNKVLAEKNESDQKILVLGVGNLLFGDEGIGVHAANYLMENYEFSPNVVLEEGGTQGFWLMSSLISSSYVIIMDAVLGGEEPGTIYRLKDGALRKSLGFNDSQHQVDLEDILIQCDLMGKKPDEIIIIGMEPEDMRSLQMEMTPLVQGKFNKFIGHVLDEVVKAGGEFTKKY